MKSDWLASDRWALPVKWRHQLGQQLPDHEQVLAWIELDLDQHLHFSQSVLILTASRLIFGPADSKISLGSTPWETIALTPALTAQLSDHAGVMLLEVFDGGQRRAAWRATLGLQAEARLWLDTFHAQLAHLSRHESADVKSEIARWHCPKCLAALSEVNEACERCSNDEEPVNQRAAFYRLWRFAKPYHKNLILGFSLTLAATAANMVPPYLTMPLMDEVLIPFQNGQAIDTWLVAKYLGGLMAAAILAWGLGWAHTYILALVSERIGADLRNTAYRHLMHMPMSYFGGKRTGDLINRVGSETDRLCLFLSLHLLEFASDVLMITMTAIILLTIDPWLALVTLLPLPFIGWLIHSVRDRLRVGFEKIDRVWSEVTNVLSDTISGIRVVKAFAQEEREIRRFEQANWHNLQVNDRLNRLWSLFSPTVTLMTEFGLLVLWAFGIWLVAHGKITVGVLTAFLAYIGRFYSRLDSMSRIVSHTQKAAAGAKRIFEILDHASSVPESDHPTPMNEVRGHIQLQQVGFRYGNRQVIRDLSLDIAPGEMIGLVGASGSGKSTLVNLICRFHDVTEGRILVDNIDIRELRLAEYRSHIGLVLQEPFLFFGTIADNIAYGKPGATREEIIAAARAAHAHEFILRLPQGYDSLVGERGQGLSGGERQRISIARALLINPQILILDEATSSVDTETEQEIQRALDNLVRGRTTIAIAHRLSTLRQADRLVVLEKGQVVEQGQHDELLARQGAYWRLHEAQQQMHDAQMNAEVRSEARHE